MIVGLTTHVVSGSVPLPLPLFTVSHTVERRALIIQRCIWLSHVVKAMSRLYLAQHGMIEICIANGYSALWPMT